MSVYKQPIGIEHFVQLVRVADIKKREFAHEKLNKKNR